MLEARGGGGNPPLVEIYRSDPNRYIVFVPLQPDGNCLYRAVENQLALESGGSGNLNKAHRHVALRTAAVDYMRNHEAEFAPFVLPVSRLTRQTPTRKAERSQACECKRADV